MDQPGAGGPPVGGGEAWDALFEALLTRHERVARRIREAMQAQLSAYRHLAADELDEGVQVELDQILRSARAGKSSVSAEEVAALAAVGERRARQGVPIDEMLRAWRIGVEIVVSGVREVGRGLGMADGALLDVVESLLAWTDVAMVTTARAHRSFELELARQDQERRASFLRGLLFGAFTRADAHSQAAAYGLNPHDAYVAIRAVARAGSSIHDLERSLGFTTGLPFRTGLSTLVDGDLAGILRAAPAANVDGVVGVGPPRALEGLAESFRLASRALMTARGFDLTGAHDVPSLGVRVAVMTDEDVGRALRARYLDPLAKSGSVSEMITSLRAYFESGMHVERAARRLFVHQNTLRYRINRFETLTGASLRDPVVAFEVWWAVEGSALQGDREDPGHPGRPALKCETALPETP